MNEYDVLVIGAGVTGSAIARELSKYELKTCVLEKDEDVCSGTSKANSGIVHGGFDPAVGSVMAKMNIRGAELIRELSKTLDFAYKQNGSMVLCFDEADRHVLEALYDRGVKNGVKEMRIISGERESSSLRSAKRSPARCLFRRPASFAPSASRSPLRRTLPTTARNFVS